MQNNLFPVFLKLEQMKVLLIGAGNVGLEKLHAILNNAPATNVLVVAKEIRADFENAAAPYTNIKIIQTEYDASFMNDCDIVIAAVNDIALSTLIKTDAKQKGKLINVADKPDLCDFYLGAIVTKGNLKIAISTNGKSPTIAKRLKEVFNELLPDEMDEVLNNLQQIRNSLKGDFQSKVNKLNELTRMLTDKENGHL